MHAPKIELRVGGKYKLIRKLGSGAFGEIFHGKRLHTCSNINNSIQALIFRKMNKSQLNL